MLIASSFDTNRTLLVLGLSDANRQRLEQGEPIHLSRKTHGVAIPEGLTILIFAGTTEAQMEIDLRDLIGATTVVNQKAPQ